MGPDREPPEQVSGMMGGWEGGSGVSVSPDSGSIVLFTFLAFSSLSLAGCVIFPGLCGALPLASLSLALFAQGEPAMHLQSGGRTEEGGALRGACGSVAGAALRGACPRVPEAPSSPLAFGDTLIA